MTKEWGITNGLKSVMYVTKDSHYLNNILTVQKQILPLQIHLNRQMQVIYNKYRDASGKIDKSKIKPEEHERINMEATLSYAIEHLEERFSFYKPYIDESDGRLYYNEREWRYVVPGGSKSDYKVPVIFAQQYPEMLNDLESYQQTVVA